MGTARVVGVRDILRIVQVTLAAELGVPEVEVVPEAKLEDLLVDSLDMIGFCHGIEERMPDVGDIYDAMVECKTVADLVAVLEARVQAAA